MLQSKKKIEIKNLDYEIEDKKLLDNVSLTIQPGGSVGVIGPVMVEINSLKSIVGYNTVDHGRIKIDGYDINNIESDKLRQFIAYSICSTIYRTYSRKYNCWPTRQMTAIIDAAINANAHSFISSIPGGYGALLNESGRNLSGGQRQKIALARTFLRDPSIIIMDEPTNSLDGETEKVMQDYIINNYKNKTFILATHKPSLLSLVERVLIVVDGKIMADGPKDEILSKFAQRENN